jgi:hypothetical protein
VRERRQLRRVRGDGGLRLLPHDVVLRVWDEHRPDGRLLRRLGVADERVRRPGGSVHDRRVDVRRLHRDGELRLLRLERHVPHRHVDRAEHGQLLQLGVALQHLPVDRSVQRARQLRHLRCGCGLRLLRDERRLRDGDVDRPDG